MKHFPLLLLLSVLLTAPVQAGQKVLATVHPIALMAASVTPAEDLTVLLPVGMTPHDFSMRPSDVALIRAADIIIWAGAEAEPYLQSFVQRWPQKTWLDVSQGAEPEDEHGGHDTHHDPHWWLSPQQMIRAQQALAQALQTDDGGFAAAVEQQLRLSHAQLAPYRERGFFVFHRAYDHWVELMGLNQVGAFTVSPEQKPGLKTLQHMREQLVSGDVVCVFSEPEFSPAVVESVLSGLDVRRGELDPMAANIPVTADGYVRFLQDLTSRFRACLQPG